MKLHILVIDDEQAQRDILADILIDAGYRVDKAADGSAGLKQLHSAPADLVLTDLKMPDMDGLEVLEKVKEMNPSVPVIIMTAFGTIPNAVQAIKRGAYDYLTKPFKKDDLLRVVKRAEEKILLTKENERLKSEVRSRYQYQNLIGKSNAMQHIYQLIERIKDVDATVLISGESGTGKELVARAIHYSGRRSDGPFVALNCGAIPDTLIESELFGHERGAFTGAHKTYVGKFEQAQGGSIFLDEIGTMRLDLQIRLLRVLQEKTIERVGANESITLDLRVIAATNENLQQKVAQNAFRTDLYHRLNVFAIHLPALRDRKEDIALLARHFIKKYAAQYEKKEPVLSAEALEALEVYHYPGNVRELENIIEKSIILNDRPRLNTADLMFPREPHPPTSAVSDNSSLPEMEAAMIIEALKESRGSLKKAAQSLGISYKTLQYRVQKHNINKNQFKT